MRTLLAALSLVVFAVSAPAQQKKWSPGPFAEARKRLQKGNYEEARAAFEELAKKDAKLAPDAAMGVAATFRAVGEADKALNALTDALKTSLNHPGLLANRADLYFDVGKWDEAEKDADAALAKDENHLLARWTKARLLRDRGKVEEADKAMRLIVRYYSARSNADNDITDPDELMVVAQAGAENARWNKLPNQFRFILNEVLNDAMKSDALVGKGYVALQKFELKEVENQADRALKVNPKHADALRLKAAVYLIAGDFPVAEQLLVQAKAVNPRDEYVLGRLAGVYLMQRRQADFDSLAKEVAGFDAKPAIFYHELAELLEERKRYTQAEEYFRKAADLRPILAGPRTGLGMLYLRMGKEAEGKKLLDEAFKSDPFNVRVANSRKVMEHLGKYATITTEHYVLKYDAEKDKILAEFLAEYLEETHAELKRQFNYEPPDKVLIEVFNSHEMFSGRTVGLPDLHTIGACTGKVVAMASPHAKGIRKPFHWGRVIRHELTHIFNLAQTDFQCPHWLTEGLAVRNENMARPAMWTGILRDRMATNELFTLDTVMLGFVRPKGPDEWTLAYCQSQLYVEYLTKTHGEASVGKLLDAYRDGVDTGTAIKRACGVEKEAFEKGYRAYLDDIMKGYGAKVVVKEGAKSMTFAELEEAQKQKPDDPELAAKLADQYMRRNKVADARKLVDLALAKKPGHPLASVVKSRLMQRGGDDDGAKAVLEEALKANPDNPQLLLAAGRLYIDAKDYTAAAKALEQGRKVAPLDGDWLEQLARLYKMTNETDKLLSVLQEVISQDPDELDGRIRLAKVSLEVGKAVEAEKFARDALQIDVHNEEARKALIEALKGQGKTAEVEKLLKRFNTP